MIQKSPNFLFFIVILGLLGAMAGCKPDLVVKSASTQWNSDTKIAEAVIANQGTQRVGEFQVNFTALECPVPPEQLIQITQNVDGLRVGESVSLTADFQSLSHPENAHLENVREIVVAADPANLIQETNEDNNEITGSVVDISGLQNYIYNEGIATVLRGILIDDSASQNLNISPGYYRIRQFRVWDDPDQKAIVLCITRSYYESATGQSVFPEREHEWVFSVIEEWRHDSSGLKFKGHDFHGHTLSLELEFDSKCVNVIFSHLDCSEVRISTQNLSLQLNTCGWDTEPAWNEPSE